MQAGPTQKVGSKTDQLELLLQIGTLSEGFKPYTYKEKGDLSAHCANI